jgi:hypothetical protein
MLFLRGQSLQSQAGGIDELQQSQLPQQGLICWSQLHADAGRTVCSECA